MIITIHGTGIELTEPLKAYAEKKIKGVIKFLPSITQADIDVGVTTHHHQKGDIFYAEVNLHVPGQMIRMVKEETDLYKAIDLVKDHLKVELKRMKEKKSEKDRDALRNQREYHT